MNTDKVALIVEDSITVRFQVKVLLEQIGVSLREAGGELGLFNLIEVYGKTPDIIIMDLTLKNEDGFTLIEKLRANKAYCHIPILVLTEHADTESVLKARALGVEGYIRKPINKDSFFAKISDSLGLKQAQSFEY